jgi:hypothetical protein
METLAPKLSESRKKLSVREYGFYHSFKFTCALTTVATGGAKNDLKR